MGAGARETVEETLELVQEAVELTTPVAVARPPPRRSLRLGTHDFQDQAKSLSRRADAIKSVAQRTMGISSDVREGTTAQKIEDFYGVRQLPEGAAFCGAFSQCTECRHCRRFQ